MRNSNKHSNPTLEVPLAAVRDHVLGCHWLAEEREEEERHEAREEDELPLVHLKCGIVCWKCSHKINLLWEEHSPICRHKIIQTY